MTQPTGAVPPDDAATPTNAPVLVEPPVAPTPAESSPALAESSPAPAPPARHTYRLLTGPDDARFCARVSQALAEGYRLYGSPAATFDGDRVIVAQAVVLADRLDADGSLR